MEEKTVTVNVIVLDYLKNKAFFYSNVPLEMIKTNSQADEFLELHGHSTISQWMVRPKIEIEYVNL